MKRTASFGLAAFLFAAPSLAADFYVDPATGSMANDGSAASPWRTIGEVIEAGLVESQEWDTLPYTSSSVLVTKNAGAPVKAGDTIWLRSGYHGELSISGHYNSAMITIAAESGHEPGLNRVLVRSSSNWTITGLRVSPELAPSYDPSGAIFDIESHNFNGPAHDVVVRGCSIFSVADATGWSANDWDQMSANGFDVSGRNITVAGNTLTNVNFGISVGAEDSLIEGNVVDGFAGDGMRGLGDNSVFQYNTIKNCHAVNANHDDGFQSWSLGGDGSVGTGEVTGIVLRGNRIINYEDPNQPNRCTLQGIGNFDGTFVDWVIENNVIITDHWHGITLLGARNSRVVNNTVIDPNGERPGPPWIKIAPHKDGTPSEGCVVRNNIVTDLSNEGPGIVEDNNIVVTDLALMFVDPAGYDLHLLPSAPAIDSGGSDLAPSLDADRIPRPQGTQVDVGAYEWHDGSAMPVGAGGAAPGTGGGTSTGGVSSGGASPGTGGAGGAAANTGSGTGGVPSAAGAAGSGNSSAADADTSSGCSCRLAAPGNAGPLGLLALCASLVVVRRRRRSRR